MKKAYMAIIGVLAIAGIAFAGADIKVQFTGPSGQGNIRYTQADGTLIMEIGQAVITGVAWVVTGDLTPAGNVTGDGSTIISNNSVVAGTTIIAETAVNSPLYVSDGTNGVTRVWTNSTPGVTNVITSVNGIVTDITSTTP